MNWFVPVSYTPFLDPLPLHDWWFWLLLQIPWAALSITFFILAGMTAAAVVLTVIVRVQE
jgi:hypothetical protein